MVRKAPDERRVRKARLWRRRILTKKGARLHARMLANADEGSLAMLDEDGVVVSWYGERPDDTASDGLLDHHVSQFYLSNDVALGVPMRDLCTAAIHGASWQPGWRRAADGTVAWAMTHIESELLGDGRLQGFSHVIRRTPFGADMRSVLPPRIGSTGALNIPLHLIGMHHLAAGLEALQPRYLTGRCA
jgi:hypothetical protein